MATGTIDFYKERQIHKIVKILRGLSRQQIASLELIFRLFLIYQQKDLTLKKGTSSAQPN